MLFDILISWVHIIVFMVVFYQAGINNDRIKLALEPEAASILCQHIVAGNVIKKTGSTWLLTWAVIL